MLEEKNFVNWKDFPVGTNHHNEEKEGNPYLEVRPNNSTHEDHREASKKIPGYIPQYSNLYRVRLEQLSASLLPADGLEIVELSKMKVNEKCCVIGLLFKQMKSRKSYVKAIEEGETLQETTEFDEVVPQDDDEFFVENGSGKRMLNLEGASLVLEGGKTLPASIHTLLSGTVALLVCSLLSDVEVQVFEVRLPGIKNLPKELKVKIPNADTPGIDQLLSKASEGKRSRLVCLVAGLHMSKTGMSSAQMFRDLLLSNIAGGPISNILDDVQAVLVLGGLIDNDLKLNKQLLRCYEFQDKQQELLDNINNSLRNLDDLLCPIAKKYPLLVLPGPGDASDSFLPQRALPNFCLPRCKNTGRLTMLSNPAQFQLGGRSIAATDGYNIQTMLGLTKGLDSELDVLEQTLNAQHFAPNCPENCATFPFQKEDNLIMSQPCVLYACGGGKVLMSRVLRSRSHDLKLLVVPKFSETREVVFLDLDTLESYCLGF
jgi:DNA polymerase delta subunit 2